MSNFNKVILLGNLTRDVELRHTQGGTAVAKFGMAINRKWSQQGEQKESTCFVDLVAWGKTAELIAQYVKKGSQLFVEGRLEFQSWEGRDGGKRSKLEVVVENFQFVGGRKEAEEEEEPPPPKRPGKVRYRRDGPDPDQTHDSTDLNDIPF